LTDIRRTLIVGSKGNLALKLKEKFPNSRIVPRSEYLSWTNPKNMKDDLGNSNYDIFLAVGITSSKANSDELSMVNFEIPARIAKSMLGVEGRIFTFGSIMERDLRIVRENPYIATKFQLSEFLSRTLNPRQYLHLRLHTLYGGNSFNRDMFLGQLFYSIKENTKFRMTSGEQVREYHHIDDDLLAMETLMRGERFGIQEISHGESMKLKDIAEQTLNYFGVPELLSLGTLSDTRSEILRPIGERNDLLDTIDFRPTIQGIISYFEEHLR
jgi:hypothetical protein